MQIRPNIVFLSRIKLSIILTYKRGLMDKLIKYVDYTKQQIRS